MGSEYVQAIQDKSRIIESTDNGGTHGPIEKRSVSLPERQEKGNAILTPNHPPKQQSSTHQARLFELKGAQERHGSTSLSISATADNAEEHNVTSSAIISKSTTTKAFNVEGTKKFSLSVLRASFERTPQGDQVEHWPSPLSKQITRSCSKSRSSFTGELEKRRSLVASPTDTLTMLSVRNEQESCVFEESLDLDDVERKPVQKIKYVSAGTYVSRVPRLLERRSAFQHQRPQPECGSTNCKSLIIMKLNSFGERESIQSKELASSAYLQMEKHLHNSSKCTDSRQPCSTPTESYVEGIMTVQEGTGSNAKQKTPHKVPDF